MIRLIELKTESYDPRPVIINPDQIVAIIPKELYSSDYDVYLTNGKVLKVRDHRIAEMMNTLNGEKG